MSNVISPIGLDLKLQPQPGHGNSKHHAPYPTAHASSSSSSSKRTSKTQKQTIYGDSSKNHSASSGWNAPAVINVHPRDEKRYEVGPTSSGASSAARAAMPDQHSKSPFDKNWVCTSQDFVQNSTPSRKDGISYSEEMTLRRSGATFIRLIAGHLKLKPICKETAYIYFHRFYMLRSLKKYEPYRIAMACLYLACKFEDHPTFKEHLIRISYMNRHKRDLSKSDKEYTEWCDRLIRDENLLLQVLGFNLKIEHFQMHIVAASQRPIEGTSKILYTLAYKISSEINRLTMLCVEYSAPVLTSVAIYLAAIYQGFDLPDCWCTSINGMAAHDMNLVVRIGEEYKELLATNSDLVKTILKESGVKCHRTTISYASPNDAFRGSTPQHSAYYGKNDHLSQQFLTNFSPDSAYSSNSSHSPPENGNSSIHSRAAQSFINSNISTNGTLTTSYSYKSSSSQHHQKITSAYSPTEIYSSSNDECMPSMESNCYSTSNIGPAVKNYHHSAANQPNTQSSLLLDFPNNYKTQKRKESQSTSSNFNHASLAHVPSDMANLKGIPKKNAISTNDAHRKKFKSDHHSTSSKHQPPSSHMQNPCSRIGSSTSNNRMMCSNPDPSMNQLHVPNSGSYHSMPHF